MATANADSAISHQPSHRCPWWIGWVLASRVRRCLEKPERLVTPLLSHGSRVLEVGPGMGFFTLPMAEKVGAAGRIYCVEVQSEMLAGLERRVQRRGLAQRVETRACTATDLGIDDLAGTIDVAVLIHVLHEIEDPRRALGAMARALRPNGRLLLLEPKGHVNPQLFQSELEMARKHGLVPLDRSALVPGRGHLMALLSRQSG